MQTAFSGVSAAISISTGIIYIIAASTASATAASVSTASRPIGLGARVVLLAASELDTGFRQLKDLQK